MFEASVNQYLMSYKGLFDLTPRITPVIATTNPAIKPYVTLQTISAEEDLVMGQDKGIFSCRVQFDSWGADYGTTKSVAIQIKNAFRNYTGDMKGVKIHSIKLVNEMDSYNSGFRTTLEFEFQYEE